jgi:transcriptional regulator with XRE-family HTH domain
MSDETLDPAVLNWLRKLKPGPGIGMDWIRKVRTRLDIQGKQLAKKMQVSPARISVLEKDEQRGAVTLKMMQKAADALDCTFVYALIPKSPQHQAKPRMRLDSAHMKGGKERQLADLQKLYDRRLSKTADD